MLDTTHAADAAEARIEGRLDAIQGGRVYGWAWDRTSPDDRLVIEVRMAGPDGEPVTLASLVADRPRADLVAAGDFGDGHHAFDGSVTLPPGTAPASVYAVARSPSSPAELTLTLPGSDEQLLERTVAPHLLRLMQAVDASRLEHRQIGRALRDVQDRLAAPPADVNGPRIAALAGDLGEVKERMEGLEVFLVRMDTALRGVEAALAAGRRRAVPPGVAAAVGAGGGALLTLLLTLVLSGRFPG